MDYINLKSNLHHFEKQNNVSLNDSHGIYDIYKCKYCGLQGKRYGLSNKLLVDVTLKKVKICDGRKIVEENKEENTPNMKVKILLPLCIFGAKNLKVGDIVDVLRVNETRGGVWVKGEEATPEMLKLDSGYKGEVLLLGGEYEIVKE